MAQSDCRRFPTKRQMGICNMALRSILTYERPAEQENKVFCGSKGEAKRIPTIDFEGERSQFRARLGTIVFIIFSVR